MEAYRNYAWPVTSVDGAAMENFIQYVKKHETLINGKKIAVFGAGIRGNEYTMYLKKLNYDQLVFIDNNKEKQGGYIEQYPIISLELFLETYRKDFFIFIAVESGWRIKEQLEQIGLTNGLDFIYFPPAIYDIYMNEYKRVYSGKYLFFGDCEFTAISLYDKRNATLQQMVKDRFGYSDTKVLAMHGMGIRAYVHILKAQIQYGMTPQNIILEVNLLTFTKTRHLLPRSQHVELLKRICKVNPSEELEDYIGLSKKRFENLRADFFVNNTKTQEKANNIESIKTYIKMNCMYRFDEKVEGIEYLKNMIAFCKKNRIRLYLFIPPINYMLAESLFGNEFWSKYDSIRSRVIDIGRNENVETQDFSTLLEDNQFCSKETPDETANYMGRTIVLNELYKNFSGV